MKVSLFRLFMIFLKVGCLAFGGGLAMVPMFEKEIVDKRKLMTSEELSQCVVISQSCPGVFCGNLSFYIGFKFRKVLGGLLSVFAVILPSLFFILGVMFVFQSIREYDFVKKIFSGVRVFIVVVVLNLGIKYLKDIKKNKATVLGNKKNYVFYPIILVSFIICVFTNYSLLYVIFGIVVLSLIFYFALRTKSTDEIVEEKPNEIPQETETVEEVKEDA